ncbi:MAG: putative quinol monooxygenase [Thermoplasmatota archaeon]
MRIYQTAHYELRPEGVAAVKRAIAQFVRYVEAHEPGTKMYAAWQEVDAPTRFVHLFIFEDPQAQKAHSQSAAVARFEAAYKPWLAGGPVRFTDYVDVASRSAS